MVWEGRANSLRRMNPRGRMASTVPSPRARESRAVRRRALRWLPNGTSYVFGLGAGGGDLSSAAVEVLIDHGIPSVRSGAAGAAAVAAEGVVWTCAPAWRVPST